MWHFENDEGWEKITRMLMSRVFIEFCNKSFNSMFCKKINLYLALRIARQIKSSTSDLGKEFFPRDFPKKGIEKVDETRLERDWKELWLCKVVCGSLRRMGILRSY